MKLNFFGGGSGEIPLFAPDGLARLEAYQAFQAGTPYPHLVLRDLFNPQALRLVLKEWPEEEREIEKHDDGTYVKKKTNTTKNDLSIAHSGLPSTRHEVKTR